MIRYSDTIRLIGLVRTKKQLAFLVVQMVKNAPGLGRSLGEENGNPLQYSCLENSMDRGAWWATVHGVAEELDTTKQLNNKGWVMKCQPLGCYLRNVFPLVHHAAGSNRSPNTRDHELWSQPPHSPSPCDGANLWSLTSCTYSRLFPALHPYLSYKRVHLATGGSRSPLGFQHFLYHPGDSPTRFLIHSIHIY